MNLLRLMFLHFFKGKFTSKIARFSNGGKEYIVSKLMLLNKIIYIHSRILFHVENKIVQNDI